MSSITKLSTVRAEAYAWRMLVQKMCMQAAQSHASHAGISRRFNEEICRIHVMYKMLPLQN